MSKGCATCKGTDHKRSSSSKCPKRKKRARESADDDGPVETYTVKRGLRGFVCPLLGETEAESLLCEMRRDVKDLSSFTVDYSILAHFFYASRMQVLDDDAEFLRLYPRFDGRALAAVLSGDADPRKVKRMRTLHDPDGLIGKWWTLCPRRYDVKLRTFLVNHIVMEYATILETNVCTHAFTRIKRAIAAGATGLEKKLIHEACYKRFFDGVPLTGLPAVDEWFDSRIPEPPTAKALQSNYWRFVPMFRRIQKQLWDLATKSCKSRGRGFKLFPQHSHGLKHLLIDSAALFELLRRVDRQTTPSTWTKFNESASDGEAGSRAYWRRYFACPERFGYSMRTDGVSVSLTMVRKAKNAVTINRKKTRTIQDKVESPLTTSLLYTRGKCVAVDPGAREPVVTCSEDETGKLVFAKLTAGQVYYETRELWREKKRKRITAATDKMMREEEKKYAAMESYSSKHGGDPLAYTAFHHNHFDDLQRVYEKRKLARLKFDKYSRRQKVMSKIVKEFFPDPGKTVLYGAGYKFMNRATFRGHRKFSHDSLLRELKRSGRTVVDVDESYTTKKCYRCFGGTVVSVSPSPHRYVHCPVCRRGANRDRNGAANILLKATGRWAKQSQSSLPSTERTSCGDDTDYRFPP